MSTPSSAKRVILEATQIDELHSFLRAENVEVPGRASGRTRDHVEIYSIVRLLATRPYTLADFPLRLLKQERPDFVLTLNGNEVGIEHTEAISQNDAKEAALRDAGIGPDMHYVKPASLTEPPKSSKQLKAEIEADEMGPGWCGDSVERGWAEAMEHFVQKKMDSVQRPGYLRLARNWLVIYDQWPAPILKLSSALPHLRRRLDALSSWTVFDRIFMLDESALIELDATSTWLYCVNHCS